MNRLKGILFVILAIFLAGCGKKPPNNCENTNGIVVYKDVTIEECKWRIHVGEAILYPINLDENFREHGLCVWVEYKIIEQTWICGWCDPSCAEVEILYIR